MTKSALIDEREAASILCYSVRALQSWRHRGGGPDFVKVSSRSIRYRRADLDKWIAARTVSNTS
ncbi:helix-turn-helix domain-containing protein [Jannaschia helgolandensis]|uniref:helix-turn-helix transcriptional regulator n=1 Tax=Jannaschia helgolandensis TaxID=188906 RepID=UPI0030DA8C95